MGGAVVMQDQPFYTRPQPKEVQKRNWTIEWSEAFNRIRVPLRFPGDEGVPEGIKIYASPAMVRNALGFAAASSLTRRRILALACPDLDSDHPLVLVAEKVAKLCIEHLEECKKL